jgi:mono/diheme cytochrome c family protein
MRRRLAAALVATAALGGCGGEDPVAGVTQGGAATVSPPPVSGGTLAVAGGRLAVAADPDRDLVWLVDLEARALVAAVELEPGDEPGRVALDPAGRAHVALRSGGAVATIDLASAKVARRAACPAPRGIALDAARGLVHVACSGGELVSLAADPAVSEPVRALRLERDLRDVVVQGERLFVSRFRAAEVLVLDAATGATIDRHRPNGYNGVSATSFSPTVAWRMQALPDGDGVLMVHQRSLATPVGEGMPLGAPYYAGPCDTAPVHGAVSEIGSEGTRTPHGKGGVGLLALPVDLALSPDGARVAVAAAGAGMIFTSSRQALGAYDALDACGPQGDQRAVPIAGEPVAVAWAGPTVVAQVRQPASLALIENGQVQASIPLPGASMRHQGHTIFHRPPAEFVAVACASCHAEGRDDGHVWDFTHVGAGLRRTQTVLGGVTQTAPLHWEGDLESLDELMSVVLTKRMGGADPTARQKEAMASWLDGLALVPKSAPTDEAAAQRGAELFHDATVGCTGCHDGARFTNNENANVGTGKAFQVPSLLGVADRAPFMHDGCASTLRDRFDTTCGGGEQHGKTAHLSPAELDDLVAYLESL